MSQFLLKDKCLNFRYQGRAADAGNPAASITASLKDLFEAMDKTAQYLPPIVLLHFMHLAFPRFAEKSEHGGFQQQVLLLLLCC